MWNRVCAVEFTIGRSSECVAQGHWQHCCRRRVSPSHAETAQACVYRLPFSTCFFRSPPVSVKALGLGSSRKWDHTVFVILCCLLFLVFSGFIGVIWCIGTFLSKIASCSILYTPLTRCLCGAFPPLDHCKDCCFECWCDAIIS